jgi:hypothetical protein
MSIGSRVVAIGLCVLLCGCGITGHSYGPPIEGEVLPVIFHSGHVVSVKTAAVGSPDGMLGLYLGPSPSIGLAGVGFASGAIPGNGAVAVTALGTSLNVGAIGGAAPSLEYTVALDQTSQIVQVVQYPWPEDYASGALQPGQPVVIRVLGSKGHVFPFAAVPPADKWRIEVGEIPLPLGTEQFADANLVAPPLMHCGARMPDQVSYCDEPRWR